MAQQFITGWVERAEGRADWTVLQRRKGVAAGVLTQQVGAAPPREIVRGALELALPTSATLLRVLDLPATDPAELQGMVELQVERISPFPPEQVVFAWEVLERTEQGVRVVLATAQRERVEQLGRPLLAAGFYPRRVDVSLLGWWHLLQAAGHVQAAGRQAHLLLAADEGGLIVSQDGQPLYFRALGLMAETDEARHELVEELGYSLTTLEAERGVTPLAGCRLWYDGEAAAEGAAALAEVLQAQLALPVERQALDTLPPLSEGVARRGWEVAAPLNLAPAAWHTAAETRRARRALIWATAAVWGVWLLLALAATIALGLRRSRVAELKVQVEQLEAPAAEVRLLKDKVADFRAYGDRSRSALECLREVCARLPAGVELALFAYRKNGTLTLRGEAAETGPIYSLVEQLERVPLLSAVKREGNLTPRSTPAGQRFPFTVTATLAGGEKAGDQP